MQGNKSALTLADAADIQSEIQPVVAATPATNNFTFSAEQQQILDEGLTGTDNLLVIGKAGVGKSTVIRELFNQLKAQGKSYLCLAPTGVAAINVGGQTIHRTIGMLSRSKFLECDLIVIDEISMAPANLLDDLNAALQAARLDPRPFGGIRQIWIGDPGQLPPVVIKDSAEAEYLEDNYHSPFFFSSHCFAKGQFRVLTLTQVFRQKDQRYPAMLNLIREGKATRPVAWLNKFRQTMQPQGVILCGSNRDADQMNQQELRRLPGSPVPFAAWISGQWKDKEFPTEKVLIIKEGARVMCVKNIYRPYDEGNPKSECYIDLVNGDCGKVIEIQEKSITFLCERTGKEHQINVEDGLWEKEEAVYNRVTRKLEKEVVGRFIQLPVRLAWAVTIHKSQGATIEKLTVDFRRPLFAAGQAYVALSRGVSLDNLWIMGRVRESDIMVDPAVAAFLKDHSAFVGIKPGSIFDMAEVSPASIEDAKAGFDEMFAGEDD